MAARPLPSQQRLREVLDYDSATGNLTWRFRDGDRWWNATWAGLAAFNAVNSEGYKVGTVDLRRCRAHRIIWKWMTGEEPPEVDHRDGDRQNNRFDNLRASSSADNHKNRKAPKSNTSGACGVHWNKRLEKWQAYIKLAGKRRHLGVFSSIDAAVAARLAAQRELGFSDRHGQICLIPER